MSEQRKLVRLKDHFSRASRMTRWRLARMVGFPAPVIIRGTAWYIESELITFEEGLRRRRIDAPSARAAREGI
jgi:hypothetical protein